MTRFFYLHGFNSGFSPNVTKVKQLSELGAVTGRTVLYHEQDDLAALGNELELAVEDARVNDEELILVGTSLGGFFTRYFANAFGLRSISINPSLEPHKTLVSSVGHELTNFVTGAKYSIPSYWLGFLQNYDTFKTHYASLTIVAKDDERLKFDDETLAKLNTESQVILTTGGHRMESLPDDVLVEVRKFVNREPVGEPDIL